MKIKNKLILYISIGAIVVLTQNTIPFQFKKPKKETTLSSQYSTIDLANFILLKNMDNTTLIDLRDKKFYDFAHIQGALNIPLNQYSENKIIISKLKKSSNIVIYGHADDYPSYNEITKIMQNYNIQDVNVFVAGWEQWQACKLPVESNK